MDRVKVLCVDDEPHILEGLALHLRRAYEVVAATSGLDGLEKLAKQGPFAVVLSDMQMPAMNGAAFLSRVREVAPDTTRMLLTGHANIQAAIAAVNEGQIFRFLSKPCPPDQLRLAFNEATEHYRLVTAERVLLEQTLQGSIRTLVDVLSITHPVAFGRAMMIKKHVSELVDALGIQNRWQVEVAAMLSQLGSISLPDDIAEKFYNGQDLDTKERAMVDSMPKVTEKLLANIPRLEPVCEILANQSKPIETGNSINNMSLKAMVLKIAVDFDELESKGLSVQLSLDTMLGRKDRYDPETLKAFVYIKGTSAERQVVKEISLQAVRVGMIFAEDVRMETGILLVTRGYEVTQSFIEKVNNYRKGRIIEPLRVVVKK